MGEPSGGGRWQRRHERPKSDRWETMCSSAFATVFLCFVFKTYIPVCCFAHSEISKLNLQCRLSHIHVGLTVIANLLLLRLLCREVVDAIVGLLDLKGRGFKSHQGKDVLRFWLHLHLWVQLCLNGVAMV